MTLLRPMEHQPIHCVPMLKSQSTSEKTIMNNVNPPQRKARSLAMAAGALAIVTLLGACNTFEGLGRDTERAGEVHPGQSQVSNRNLLAARDVLPISVVDKVHLDTTGELK